MEQGAGMRTDRGTAAASPYTVFALVAGAVLGCTQLFAWLVPGLPAPAAGLLSALILGVPAAAAWHRLAHAPLRRARRRMGALLRAVPEPLLVLDRDGMVLAANAAAVERFGEGGRLVGQSLFGRQPGDEARGILLQLREAARARRPARFSADLNGCRFDFAAEPAVGEAESDEDAVVVRVEDTSGLARAAALDALCRELDAARPADLDAGADLLTQACRQLVAALGLRVAWVARRDEAGALSVIACAGHEMDADAELRRNPARWDDGGGRGPVAGALRTGTAQVVPVGEAGVQEWQKTARRFGIRCVCALPVRVEQDAAVVLALASRRNDAFEDAGLLASLERVAARLGSVLSAVADRERLVRREAALDAVAEAVFVTDRAGQIEWLNAGFARLTGYAPEEAVGRTPRLLNAARQDAGFYRDLWSTILAGSAWTGEMVNRRKDGTFYVARQSIAPLRDGAGAVKRFLAVQEDVSGQRALEERMRHMAQYDGLTDLPNRALFLDRLGHGIAVARRNHHALALLTVNLDHFRLVNDTYGLLAGDLLLQEVASRLRQAVRDSDTVARVGGDEFAVVAPQVMVREDAGRVAQKLQEALRPPCAVEGQEIKVTASIGVALYPQDGETAEQLAARSSGALKLVKMQDRNGYRFASPG